MAITRFCGNIKNHGPHVYSMINAAIDSECYCDGVNRPTPVSDVIVERFEPEQPEMVHIQIVITDANGHTTITIPKAAPPKASVFLDVLDCSGSNGYSAIDTIELSLKAYFDEEIKSKFTMTRIPKE